MDWIEQVGRVVNGITVAAGLAIILIAKFLGYWYTRGDVRAVGAERDKREAMLVAERDAAVLTAKVAQEQRDAADKRTERLAEAFQVAYNILVRGRAGAAALGDEESV